MAKVEPITVTVETIELPNITPILDPLLALLRSRAVLYALLNIVLYVLASNYGATPEFLELIKQLGLAVIIKMGAEDVAAKWGANRPPVINAGEAIVNQPAQTVPGQ
jgi:hypothetical protein